MHATHLPVVGIHVHGGKVDVGDVDVADEVDPLQAVVGPGIGLLVVALAAVPLFACNTSSEGALWCKRSGAPLAPDITTEPWPAYRS